MHNNTQHSQEKDVQAICGIRTRNLSKGAVVNWLPRPRGHWNRQLINILKYTE